MELWPFIRSMLFRLNPERAHDITLSVLPFVPHAPTPTGDPRLVSTVAGLRFPNPVGLSAGFDKNARVAEPMLRRGFGFVEVGTLTPLPQPGNPKPRLFRLDEDEAIINRMGFNNVGLTDALARLRAARSGVIGVNIGANKHAIDRFDDYAQGMRAVSSVADYVTINISSPNTPALRELQEAGLLDGLLEAVAWERTEKGPPVFLKIAPEMSASQIDAVARISSARGIDALIVSNTTTSRPSLKSNHAAEAGGLSGAPLAGLAYRRLQDFRAATGGAMPLIASGGIGSGSEAYARILAGASLIQVYSALIYEGLGLVGRINRELVSLLERDGFASIADAVGQGAKA